MGSIPIIGSSCTLAIGIDLFIMNDPDLERVTHSLDPGRLPKWTTGTDCKSVGTSLRWFESNTVHFWQPWLPVGSAALIAQLAERILGKNEVMGSNPIEGFLPKFDL